MTATVIRESQELNTIMNLAHPVLLRKKKRTDFGIKILIVEDQLITRLFIKKTLKKLGFWNVTWAVDGNSAIEELKRHQFDLILSDWAMPGMDGLEFLQTVKKSNLFRKIPFFMISGENQKDRVLSALAAGANQYIVKPFHPKVLEMKIKQAFDFA